MSSIQHMNHSKQKCLAVNTFFNDWYTAVQYVATRGSLAIQPIVGEVDIPQDNNLVLGDILIAFSAGLAFVGLPEVGAAVEVADGINAAATTAGQFLVTALQQAPGVAKAIWPSGTTDVGLISIT